MRCTAWSANGLATRRGLRLAWLWRQDQVNPVTSATASFPLPFAGLSTPVTHRRARLPREVGCIGRGEQSHAPMIYCEQRREVPCLGTVRQSRPTIVQNQPMVRLADGKHGMVLAYRSVADQQQAQVLCGDAGFAKQHIFGDRVILAIAAAAGQSLERRRPEVGNAMLREIAGVDDRRIHHAVDGVEFLASRPFLSLVYHGEKTQGG